MIAPTLPLLARVPMPYFGMEVTPLGADGALRIQDFMVDWTRRQG
jgi:hypothetical protein